MSRSLKARVAALEQAEQQCLADEDARTRRRERDRERRAAADGVQSEERSDSCRHRKGAGLRRQIPLALCVSVSGLRRSTLLELSGMELHEVAHVHRCFAGEFAQGVRHAVVTPLLSQFSHG